MKKLVIAVLLVVFALSAIGCGGGGLSTYYGLKQGDITEIVKWSNGRTKTIEASKYGDFMKTFDVEYEYCTRSDFNSASKTAEYQVKYDGAQYTLFILVLSDGRVVAQQQQDASYTSYYISVDTVVVPPSLL